MVISSESIVNLENLSLFVISGSKNLLIKQIALATSTLVLLVPFAPLFSNVLLGHLTLCFCWKMVECVGLPSMFCQIALISANTKQTEEKMERVPAQVPIARLARGVDCLELPV